MKKGKRSGKRRKRRPNEGPADNSKIVAGLPPDFHKLPIQDRIRIMSDLNLRRQLEERPNMEIPGVSSEIPKTVTITPDQIARITRAILREQEGTPRYKRLFRLMMLHAQPNVEKCAEAVKTDKAELLRSLEELHKLK